MSNIDSILRAYVAQRRIAGVVALATDAAGATYQGAFGNRVLDGDAAMTPDTIFWIASMTKALTAAACMQLVEQGRLDLDAPIAGILPALATPRILTGFDEAGAPLLSPARRPITLRQLLTHTSGFAYGMWNADMARYDAVSGIPRAETYASAETCLPLAFEPGTGWAYGVGIDWAGKAVEAVSGQGLEAYLREHLFTPLGMRDTGFLLPEAARPRVAGMHARLADGGVERVAYDPPQNPAHFTGGGGLFSTGPDYLRFIRMMLNRGTLDGVQVLRPETVAAMGANSMGDLCVQPMRTAIPAMTNDADFYPGIDKKWGLSFLLTTHDVPGARRAGSLTWAGLHNTYYWIDPTSGIGGVVMTQLRPFADRTVLELFDAFERGVYAAMA
jgi:CubicO group peptidase (beta-lactamase class C family)